MRDALAFRVLRRYQWAKWDLTPSGRPILLLDSWNSVSAKRWAAMEAFCMNPERRLGDQQFSELVDEFFAANDALNNAVRAGKC
jgi:hypothetical protein